MAFSIEISSREVGGSRQKWNLESDVNGKITLQGLIELANRTLVAVTTDVLKDEINRGFPTDYVETTDGVVGKPYQQVDIAKKGTIEIQSRGSVSDLIGFIFKDILKRSPVRTGEYIRSHIMLYNGTEVAANLSEALKWADKKTLKQGDTIRFMNFQPYARKLERFGVTSQGQKVKTAKSREFGKKRGSKRSTTVQKPNGAYFLTANNAKKRFSKASGRIRFEMVPGGAISGLPSTGKRNSFKKTGRPYLYPSIIINVDVRGLTQ